MGNSCYVHVVCTTCVQNITMNRPGLKNWQTGFIKMSVFKKIITCDALLIIMQVASQIISYLLYPHIHVHG